MKLTIAFLSIILTLGFGACSNLSGEKKVTMTTCEPGDAGKVVLLKANSYESGGTVVRLVQK